MENGFHPTLISFATLRMTEEGRLRMTEEGRLRMIEEEKLRMTQWKRFQDKTLFIYCIEKYLFKLNKKIY